MPDAPFTHAPPVRTLMSWSGGKDSALALHALRAAEATGRVRLDGLLTTGAAVAFGDLFLADVRAYRERLVAPTGLTPRFPLWGEDTAALARRFVALGFRAVLVCVDPAQLDPAFCGREYDARLLDALPPGADPCGEGGEFHTFVYDGPGFARPVAFDRGAVVERGGFWFCDLVPGGGSASAS